MQKQPLLITTNYAGSFCKFLDQLILPSSFLNKMDFKASSNSKKYILEKHQLDFNSKEQNGPLQKKFPIKISASCRNLFLVRCRQIT